MANVQKFVKKNFGEESYLVILLQEDILDIFKESNSDPKVIEKFEKYLDLINDYLVRVYSREFPDDFFKDEYYNVTMDLIEEKVTETLGISEKTLTDFNDFFEENAVGGFPDSDDHPKGYDTDKFVFWLFIPESKPDFIVIKADGSRELVKGFKSDGLWDEFNYESIERHEATLNPKELAEYRALREELKEMFID